MRLFAEKQPSAEQIEEQRIALSNLEREVKNASENVMLASADIRCTEDRISVLKMELSAAQEVLPRRKKRHENAVAKLADLQDRLERMKAAKQ